MYSETIAALAFFYWNNNIEVQELSKILKI